jgi:hypothetical protein
MRLSLYTVVYFKAALTCGYDRGVLHVELMLKSNDDIALIEVNGRLIGIFLYILHFACIYAKLADYREQ